MWGRQQWPTPITAPTLLVSMSGACLMMMFDDGDDINDDGDEDDGDYDDGDD